MRSRRSLRFCVDTAPRGLRSRPRPIAGRISRRICSSVEPMTLWVADIYDPSKA
jgi:hypothetical protein